MKKLSGKTFKLGLCCVLIAIISFTVWHFWKVEQERQRQQLADTIANQPFDVICATADLDVGTVVTPEMIVVREFPCCKVPGDIIWDPSVAVGRC